MALVEAEGPRVGGEGPVWVAGVSGGQLALGCIHMGGRLGSGGRGGGHVSSACRTKEPRLGRAGSTLRLSAILPL